MAKIVDSTQIKRLIPDGQQDIVGYSTEGTGAFLDVASAQLAEVEKRRTDSQIAKADIEMSTALASRLEQTKEDPDYATMGDRFDADTEKRLGEITSGIGDGEARGKFEEIYRMKMVQARQKVNGVAWGKEVEFEKGETIRLGTDARNAAVLSGDLKTGNLQYRSLIDTNVARGIYGADEGEKLKQAYQNDTAVSYIESLDPEKRLNALKQPDVKKNMAPEVYAKLMREAKGDGMLAVAQDTVDYTMRQKEMTLAEATEYTAKKFKKDPKQRKLAQAEVTNAYGRSETAMLRDRRDKVDDYYLLVTGDEKMKVADIPKEDKEILGASGLRTLRAAEANTAANKKVEYNAGVEMALEVAQARGDRNAIIEIYNANKSLMSESQQKKWIPAVGDASVPPVVKSAMTAGATATAFADSKNYSRSQKAEFKLKFDNWYQQVSQQLEKDVPPDVITKQLLSMAKERVIDDGVLWDTTKAPIDMDQEEFFSALALHDPEIVSEVEDFYKMVGFDADYTTMLSAIEDYEKLPVENDSVFGAIQQMKWDDPDLFDGIKQEFRTSGKPLTPALFKQTYDSIKQFRIKREVARAAK